MTLAHLLKAIGGGAIGAVAGYLAFQWLLGQGLYALAIPGAGLGLGCGLAAPDASLKRGVLCGVLGVLVGVATEWRFFPFIEDESFAYFVTHLHELKPLTLLMIAAGGLFAGWLGRGRQRTSHQ